MHNSGNRRLCFVCCLVCVVDWFSGCWLGGFGLVVDVWLLVLRLWGWFVGYALVCDLCCL